jgi:hypothetical protein
MADFTGPIVVTTAGGTITSTGNFSVTTPGVSWIPTTITADLRGVSWMGYQYMAAGLSVVSSTGLASAIFTSQDGLAWATYPVGAGTPPAGGSASLLLNGIASNANYYFAAGSLVTVSGGTTTTSGVILESINVPTAYATTQQFLGVTYQNISRVPIAVGAGGVIMANYALRTSGTTNQLNGVASNTSIVVAVGASGTILISSDQGATWTTGSSGTINNLNAIAWCGSQFVATGDAGAILTSTNGTSWVSHASGTSNTLYGVACSGTQIVAVGVAGTILTSSDGITWTTRTSGTSNTLYGVAWADMAPPNGYPVNQFVAVGTNVILLSR